MSMSVAVRARQPPTNPYHGKYIYLYQHLKTNQIIYSLKREIHKEKVEKALLKQLTFYGKKTVPTKLRRDQWLPFATVTFPQPEHGLRAYQYLREYRFVRDHSWTFAPTKADLEKAEEQQRAQISETEDGQGDKAGDDSVQHKFSNSILSHYTLWPSKALRAKMLMDQRATSVADLSHIITRSMIFTGEVRSFREQSKRKDLWRSVKRIAATDPAEVQKMEDERKTLESIIASAKANLPSNANQQARFEVARVNKKRQRRLDIVIAQINRIRKAREAVDFAVGKDVSEAQRAKWSKSLKYIVQQYSKRQVVPNYDATAATARKEAKDVARPTNWWRSKPRHDVLPGQRQVKPKALTRRDRIALKHWTPEQDVRRTSGVPREGVLVQWGDLRHAQYAQEWHKDVYHETLADPKLVRVDTIIDKLIQRKEAEAEAAARTQQEREDKAERKRQRQEEAERRRMQKMEPDAGQSQIHKYLPEPLSWYR